MSKEIETPVLPAARRMKTAVGICNYLGVEATRDRVIALQETLARGEIELLIREEKIRLDCAKDSRIKEFQEALNRLNSEIITWEHF